MKKYIALGDSLTAQDGHINYLNETYGLDILNLAVSAGSNYLQFHRLRNCVFTGEVGADTTLIWQIAPLQRYHEVKDKSKVEKYCKGDISIGTFDWVPVELNLVNKSKVALLANNEYFNSADILDFENSFQDLVSEIFLWSNLVKRIILLPGWTVSISANTWALVQDFLKQKSNIEFVDPKHGIVDWCLLNKVPFADPGHPIKEGYVLWCKDVLVSKL